ncbi:superoxide dismutase [candidate division WOR-3 bacterium]|nr:superoxide dismutase [candidate division WOR-3 bacterium]
MKKRLPIWGVLLMLVVSADIAAAHCEIPCGIYGDEMRFDMIAEHITTVEKSMQMIVELSKAADRNDNQLVRWVMNKEEHANYIQDIVSQYFLTQRIVVPDAKDPAVYERYVKQLALLQQMLVYAMKAKQSVDLVNVERLRVLLAEFKEMYVEHQHKKH